jgi:low temperature requirement protein LtrA
LQVTLLFLAVWWVWVYTSWITNWLNPEKTPVRLLLFANDAWAGWCCRPRSRRPLDGPRPCGLPLPTPAMQVGKTVFLWRSTLPSQSLARANAIRITAWLALSAIFWIAADWPKVKRGCCFGPIALGIEYISPAGAVLDSR